jgi:hypothetical protein
MVKVLSQDEALRIASNIARAAKSERKRFIENAVEAR